MRVAAIGDAHLGRSYYPFTTDGGVNQREWDFERSFEAAVDLALAQSPDLICWLGDVFDHPRPTYRSYRVVQRAFTSLRHHGVGAVVISGNHDTPRLPGTGSPYSALADTFPEMHFAHRLAYERFELPGLVVHAVPQMLTVEAALEALDAAARSRSGDKTNLLLTHPRLTQLQPKHADINEIEVDAGRLQSDLVLLGHYHTHARVDDNLWYAGSTDSFQFSDEPEKPKGIVVLDTDSGECRHLPITGTRPLVTLETVYATGLSPAELFDRVMQRAAAAPERSVARLYLEGVDPQAYRMLDLQAVRDAARHALYLKLEPQFMSVATTSELPSVETIGGQWDGYLGHDYLRNAVEAAG
jgi:DNA repair exonuclease SbcCD nuclease subunit